MATATNSVSLGNRRLNWLSRAKNKLVPAIGLGNTARFLSTLSHAQHLNVKVDPDALRYLNDCTGAWVEVESSGIIAGRLAGSFDGLSISSPLSSAQVKGIFRALMKRPFHGLGLSELGFELRGQAGQPFRMPVSWRDLHDEIVPVNVGHNSDDAVGSGFAVAWSLGISVGVGSCLYLRVKNGEPDVRFALPGVAAWALGFAVGYSAYYLKAFFTWAPKRLVNMASFGRDYDLTLRASNGEALGDANNKRLAELLRTVKEELALRISAGMSYAELKGIASMIAKPYSERRSNLLLVSHPFTPREELIAFAGNGDSSIRGKALERLKNQLTPVEVESLPTLSREDVILALLEWDLPADFYLKYLTGSRAVDYHPYSALNPCYAPPKPPLITRIYDKVKDSLTEDNIAAILQRDQRKAGANEAFYEQVWAHPRARKSDVIAAAIAWFPGGLTQKALPVIQNALREDTIIALFASLDLERGLSPDSYYDTPQIKRDLVGNPHATKKVGMHAIRTCYQLDPIREMAFDRFQGEFTETDLNELYDSENKNRGNLKTRIVSHPNFSRALRVKVACEDQSVPDRLAALGALTNPTEEELEAIISANVNEPVVIGPITAGSFSLTRKHHMQLCTSTVAGAAVRSWSCITKPLNPVEEIYLAANGAEDVKVEVVKRSADRRVYMTALRSGGPKAEAAALDKVAASLTAAEIDELVPAKMYSTATLERLGRHPQVSVQAVARVLLNEYVIVKSKKVVDSPESTESYEEFDTDGYGQTIGSHREERTIPEESHQEYDATDLQKAVSFFRGKSADFVHDVLAIIRSSNPSLAEGIRKVF